MESYCDGLKCHDMHIPVWATDKHTNTLAHISLRYKLSSSNQFSAHRFCRRRCCCCSCCLLMLTFMFTFLLVFLSAAQGENAS